jgi:ABC-2 type transport system permease protein
VLLCGLFVARADMATWLQVISAAFPLTYAYDALARVTEGSGVGARLVLDLCVTIGATLLALALGAATLRRRTG